MNNKKTHPIVKKQKPINKFPNISLIFTECKNIIKKNKKSIFLTNKFFLLLGIFLSILLLIFLTISLWRNLKTLNESKKEKEVVLKEIKKWQNMVKEYKDYRDGYFMLSVLEYRIKNYDKSKEYLNKVLIIDPNFKQGREMELILKNKN